MSGNHLALIANQSQQRKPAPDAYFELYPWHECANLLAEIHRWLWKSVIGAVFTRFDIALKRSTFRDSVFLKFFLCHSSRKNALWNDKGIGILRIKRHRRLLLL